MKWFWAHCIICVLYFRDFDIYFFNVLRPNLVFYFGNVMHVLKEAGRKEGNVHNALTNFIYVIWY